MRDVSRQQGCDEDGNFIVDRIQHAFAVIELLGQGVIAIVLRIKGFEPAHHLGTAVPHLFDFFARLLNRQQGGFQDPDIEISQVRFLLIRLGRYEFLQQFHE